jgi:Uma2 family endonuclease
MNTTTPEPHAPPVEKTRASEGEPRLRRFTVEEYHAMGRAGILGDDDHVELIDGQIIAMPPIGGAHASHASQINRRLNRLLFAYGDDTLFCDMQNPVRLDDGTEPEPDVAIVRRTTMGEVATHHDALLVVEVADTTLDYDRGVKLPRYAAAGIPEVWIVNVQAGEIEVYRAPRPEAATYATKTTHAAGDTLTLAALPDAGSVAVADILPPPEEA